MGADFSRICAWFVVNREAYGEGLRLFYLHKVALTVGWITNLML
jgi:hypothetical protein